MPTRPRESKKTKWFFAIFISVMLSFLIFAGFAFFLWWYAKKVTKLEKKEIKVERAAEELANVQTKLNQEEEIRGLEEKVEERKERIEARIYQYKIDYIKTPPEDLGKLSEEELRWAFDQKIYLVNKQTGKEEMLIESVKKAVPELQDQFNVVLMELSFPETGNEIYFMKVLMQSDAPPFDIYAFNHESRSFKKLKVGDDFSGWIYLVSEDKKRVVIPFMFADYGSVRQLLLLDLEKDEKKVLLTLPENESLDAAYGGVTPEIKMKWFDERTIEYDVYDQTRVTREKVEKLEQKPKIATRSVTIE